MVSFPQASPPKPCAHLSPPHTATCPAHLILLDFTTRTILGKEYRSLSSSLCNFLHSPVTSSLLGPNTFLNTLFSITLSLHSSLNVSDQVSHQHCVLRVDKYFNCIITKHCFVIIQFKYLINFKYLLLGLCRYNNYRHHFHNRFATSHKLFLQNCKTADTVQIKAKRFHKLILSLQKRNVTRLTHHNLRKG